MRGAISEKFPKNNKNRVFNILLFIASFFPIMQEAIASISVIVLLLFSIWAYRDNISIRYQAYGIRPLIINTGFFLVLLVSCLYSKDPLSAIKGMKSSVLIFVFPLVAIYVMPRITKKMLTVFSIGYILSNLVLILYFFNILVKGMAIDRIPSLLESNIFEKISYLSQYPYEFTISKALKHLPVIYETHQVYLALGFILALILVLYLMYGTRNLYLRITFFIPATMLLAAIIYCQSNTGIITLILCVVLFPFFIIQSKRYKLIPFTILIVLVLGGLSFGWFKAYSNKNTMANINLIKAIVSGEMVKENTDKRYYIYSCSLSLVRENYLFGHGVGNVQPLLNDCYQERNYLVAEYNSIGSDINTHNYYLHMAASAGILGLMSILLFFYKNLYLAFTVKNYFYAMFLTVFIVGLLTENLFLRMMGVFPFAVMNSLFYSHCRFQLNE